MFTFNFVQTLGLLFFFFGLIILNRCSAMESEDYLAKSLPEASRTTGTRLREKEMTRHLIRKTLLYSVLGLFISLLGMAMFFVSTSQ